MKLRVLAISVFLLLLAAGGFAQDQVDELVRSEMQKQKIPGLALGVYREGKIVLAKGYGLANVELDVPVKPETIFQSGSVGKQFTATAVMMLVEEGRIGLDDSITKYFPEAPDTWKPVKIRNLLSHTSGLAEYESEEMTKRGGPINMRADYTEDELVKIIEKFPMDFKPGEKWAYRNTNYVLLGVIIHKVSGKFYGDFLQERVFKPLGMNSTRVISDIDLVPNRSAGYELKGDKLQNQEWVSPFFNSTADGALYFNVLDLAMWDEALYGEKLLKRSSLEQMWSIMPLNNGRPNSGDYGFAWAIKDINGHRLYEHSGAWQGFTTHIARYVDDRLTIVVLTNLDAGHSNPGRIAHKVAEIYEPAVGLAAWKTLPDQQPRMTGLVKAVLESAATGNPRPDDFTPEYRAEIFPNRIKRAGELLKGFGPLQSLELVGSKQHADLKELIYRARFQSNNILVRVFFDPANKIDRLSYSE